MITATRTFSRTRTAASLALFAAACSLGAPSGEREHPQNASGAQCGELPLPVVSQVAALDHAAACRLSVAALIALLSDSNAATALTGHPIGPSEFIVRREPYLPVGSTGPATEQILVTIRLPRARWDADVWFTDSLTSLAVSLVHKPM